MQPESQKLLWRNRATSHDRDSQGAGESGEGENAFLVRKTEREMFAQERADESSTPYLMRRGDRFTLKISHPPPSL